MDSIFALLKNESSDEEKFVALMIIPKYIKIGDIANVSLVFSKMNFEFLARLLICGMNQILKFLSQVIDKDDMSADLMRIVAIRIIACFSSFEQFASKPELQAFLGPLIECIQFFENVENIEAASREDAYLSLATTISDLVSYSTSINFQDAEIDIISTLFDKLGDDHFSNLLSLHQMIISKSAFDTQSYVLLILAIQFQNTVGVNKFALLDYFVNHLSTCVEVSNSAQWISPIKVGINMLMQNKLSSVQNDKVITIILMLIRLIGAKHFFESPTTTQPILKFDKFMALTLHIICAEIRVLVDDYKIPEKTSFIQEIDENDQCILPLSLETLDYILLFISSDLLDDSTDFDCEIMLSIRGTLTEAFLSIAAFLDEIHSHYILQNMNFHLIDNISVFFAMRVLATWYAEESNISKDELSQMIPLFNAATMNTFTCIDERMLEFIGPAYENITADKEISLLFVKVKAYKSVCDYLNQVDATTHVEVVESLTSALRNIEINVTGPTYKSALDEIRESLLRIKMMKL